MFERFKTRSHELERIDTGDYTAAEYRRWQKEMRFIHGIFGEARALRNTLYRDLIRDGGERFSVLDIGAGEGTLLRKLKRWSLPRSSFAVGVEIGCAGLDAIAANADAAVRADGLHLPFKNGSFDRVFCTLVLHHMSDESAVGLLKEMARVAAKRIYVIDLNRHPTAFYTYKMIGRFLLQKFTLEDGSLSILRSFSPTELLDLAERAELTDVRLERSRFNRLILSGRAG